MSREQSTLGVSGKGKLKKFTINLVEQPGWKPWDPGGLIGEKASESAWEYASFMAEHEGLSILQDLAGALFKPKAPSGPREWSPRQLLTSDDLELLWEGLKNNDQRLEAIQQIIIDTAMWMYEEAMMPSDTDMRDALVSTKEESENRVDIDWDLWDPLLAAGIQPVGILREMMGSGIGYWRKSSHYDRYLEFDLNLSGAPQELLRLVPKKDRPEVIRAIEYDWKQMVPRFVEHFFRVLTKEMQEVSVDNRTNWKKTWKETLKSADLKSIQAVMLAYVRKVREQEGSVT